MRHKKKNKKRRKVLQIAAILIAIPLIVILIVLIIRASGKIALYKNKEKVQVLNVDSFNTPVKAAENDGSYVWKEGDIKYNNRIYRYNDEILTFLILGIDNQDKVYKGEVTDYKKGGQSDTIILTVLNPKNNSVKLIAVNRNTITDVDVYNSDGTFAGTSPLQITLQHGYGDGRELSCERSVNSVSKLFKNIPIHGYISINMGAIPDINDAVGGVPVTVMENSKWYSKNLEENVGNTIVLHGIDAYEYLQNRNVDDFDSATDRLNRQKQYLKSFVDIAKAKTKEDITFPITLYEKVKDYVVTDISVTKMSYLASELLKYEFNADSIVSLSGETKEVNGFEEFYPDENALYELIIETFYEQIN